MKKIISLFERDYTNKRRLVINKITEGAEWVIEGKGVATRKFDGTCVMISNGKYYKRYEIKKDKKSPIDFIATNQRDLETGKQQGWIPVIFSNSDNKYHVEAFNENLQDGTYELCGPRIQKNPEKFDSHCLILHGSFVIDNVPVEFEELKDWLIDKDIEGIVWHHLTEDKMVKIKKKDFGLIR